MNSFVCYITALDRLEGEETRQKHSILEASVILYLPDFMLMRRYFENNCI